MRLKLTLALAAAAPLLFAASPSFAAVTITPTLACSAAPTDITNVAAGSQVCSGYYAGQLLSNGGNDPDNQKAALMLLGFNTTGFNFNSYPKISGLAGSQSIAGLGPLTGTTYIGIHYGGGANSPTPGQDVTAFYRLDLGSSVINSVNLNYGSSSDIILYATSAVPEPATWGMMLAGFGIVGGALRGRRRVTLATV
jgi:hypothetical protein